MKKKKKGFKKLPIIRRNLMYIAPTVLAVQQLNSVLPCMHLLQIGNYIIRGKQFYPCYY